MFADYIDVKHFSEVDAKEWKKRWPSFNLGTEIACRHCGAVKISTSFMDRLQGIRKKFGHSMAISSGYRCPTHNSAVSRSGVNSAHPTGHGADVRVSGSRALDLVRIALDPEFGITGLGIKQNGSYTHRFIHLDDMNPKTAYAPRPHIWSY